MWGTHVHSYTIMHSCALLLLPVSLWSWIFWRPSLPGVHIRGAYQGCILSLDTTVQPGCKQGCRQSIKTQISIVASTQRYRLLKSVGMEDIKRPFMWKINVVSESSTTINNSMAPTKVAQILVGRKNIHIPLFTHHCPWPDQHHCHHHCHCHLRQRRFT